MSLRTLSILIILSSLLTLIALTNLPTDMHTQTIPDATYKAALESTDPSGYELPLPDTPEEAGMLSGIEALFTNYTYENLENKVTEVYAEKVYFRDAFRQFDNPEDMRDYLLHGLEPLAAAEFVFNRVIRSGGEFYIDWTMRVDFKSTPANTWEESIGMSHIRYNSEGKVIFHQDYWDPTDIVYRRIPIAKQLIAYTKGKM
ncbi:MAG: nuclear transport factor 2 family protein [Opitutaceae bacterium]